jgi:hypothetical protein
VQPARNLAWFAPEAARLMFLAGNNDRGGFWLNLVETLRGNPDLARQAPGLRLLGRLARGKGGIRQPGSRRRLGQGDRRRRSRRRTGLRALRRLGPEDRRLDRHRADHPERQLAAQINQAAMSGRRGETVLLSLIAFGGDRLASTDPRPHGGARRS